MLNPTSPRNLSEVILVSSILIPIHHLPPPLERDREIIPVAESNHTLESPQKVNKVVVAIKINLDFAIN